MSKESKVKKDKSGNSAVNHWKLQRLSAFLLLILAPYMVYKFSLFWKLDYVDMTEAFRSWFDLLLVFVSLAIALWHGLQGLKVIIEDYVSSKQAVIVCVLLLHVLYAALAIILLLAISSILIST